MYVTDLMCYPFCCTLPYFRLSYIPNAWNYVCHTILYLYCTHAINRADFMYTLRIYSRRDYCTDLVEIWYSGRKESWDNQKRLTSCQPEVLQYNRHHFFNVFFDIYPHQLCTMATTYFLWNTNLNGRTCSLLQFCSFHYKYTFMYIDF